MVRIAHRPRAVRGPGHRGPTGWKGIIAMITKVRTATVHTHHIEMDGVEYETTFPGCEYIDPRVEVEDGRTVITYATLDDYWPWSPLEDDECIEFKEFDNAWDRDAWAEEWLAGGWTVFFVNHYEHSLSRFSVIEDMTLHFVCDNCDTEFETRAAGEGGKCVANAGHPAWEGHDVSARARSPHYRAGWDDRPSGVIALHPDIANPLETAIDAMSSYTAWANGEVYTIAREEYDAEGVRVDCDSVGGYFGAEAAKAAIENA